MRVLLTPRWIAAHVVVLILGLVCIGLGFWQLSRLDERRVANTVQQQRFEAPPTPIDELLTAVGGDVESLEFRRATATGRFEPSSEQLVRSQVREGRAGFEILTPLLRDGDAVLVNRGWVPLELGSTPVAGAPPAEGTVTVEGVVRLSEERGAIGQEDSESGEDDVVSRVDLGVVEARTGIDLVPVYLEIVGTVGATDLPVPSAAPDFDDDGPHLSYAVQWFSFAAVGIIGYGALLRRAVKRA